MKYLVWLAFFVGLYQLYTNPPVFEGDPIVHGVGQVAPDVPKQYSLDRNTYAFEHNGFRIIPLTNFDMTARVLHRRDYSPATVGKIDPIDEIAPVDLALGWRAMSDEQNLDQIKVTQSNRWYYWRVASFPIPRREIEVNSANMHFVPASVDIEKKLKQVVEGSIVSFKGYLIRIEKGNWNWTSSLTRDDTGAGACETIWVEEFEILNP